MIDKYKLWSYIALVDSMTQYEKSGNEQMCVTFASRLQHIWDTSLSIEECEWLDENAFNEPFGWDRPEKYSEVAELIKLLEE